MPRTKLVIMACFAMFALSALAAATAFAGEWDVNGKPLVGTKEIASPIKVLAHGVFERSGVGPTFECLASEMAINGGELVAPDELRAKDLTFKECRSDLPNCFLGVQNILTLPIHGLAELDGTLNTLLKILPLPSKTFIILKWEGATCVFFGFEHITGTFDLLMDEGRDPKVLQQALAFSLKGSLREGEGEGTLTGLTGDIKLASGETWNFL
jgi:hypothetical protein